MSAEVRARHGESSTGLANGLTSMEGERPRARIWRERLRARLTLGNALSNVSLVFRKISSDHRQIELPQDAGIRFAFQ